MSREFMWNSRSVFITSSNNFIITVVSDELKWKEIAGRAHGSLAGCGGAWSEAVGDGRKEETDQRQTLQAFISNYCGGRKLGKVGHGTWGAESGGWLWVQGQLKVRLSLKIKRMGEKFGRGEMRKRRGEKRSMINSNIWTWKLEADGNVVGKGNIRGANLGKDAQNSITKMRKYWAWQWGNNHFLSASSLNEGESCWEPEPTFLTTASLTTNLFNIEHVPTKFP